MTNSNERGRRRGYTPVANDHISALMADLVPEEYEGTDQFLDVVTWNIRFFHHRDWERVEQITHILTELNADVIVFQEILEGALDPVAEGLDKAGAGYYQVAYGTTGGNQRVAIMYDLDWIRAKDDIRELFGKREILTGRGKDAFPRLPLYANLTAVSHTGDPFDFQLVGLHLKSQRGGGHAQRRLAAESLARWFEIEAPRVDSDIIVIGDWNEKPNASTWDAFNELEARDLVAFQSINGGSGDFSHLMYRNKRTLGSRLDLNAVSIAAMEEIAGNPEVVRWKNLSSLLDSNPRAKDIKALFKVLRERVSDHLPVLTRYYHTEQSVDH